MIKRLWEKWKYFAEVLGNFQTKIIFSLLYYILVLPFGIVSNYFNDFLDVRGFPKWTSVEDNSSTLKKLKEQ